MMAGNPNWWNMNIPPQQQPSSSPPPFLSSPPVPLFQYPHQYVFGSSPNSLPLTTLVDYTTQELPQSWSQLLLGGVSGEEDTYKFSASHFPTRKLLGNWEEQTILNNSSHVKQEVLPHSSKPFGQQYGSGSEELYPDRAHSNTPPYTNINAWSNMMPVSSPTSCVTTLSSNTNNNLLDFSNSISKKVDRNQGCTKNPQNLDQSSTECKSTATGGACKKARVQTSSTQSPLKVRKEKLGDRITALHQLVSPFGKTDTASVLLEAIGYIRFLQGQIEALSSPYLNNASGNLKNPPSENEEDDDIPKDLRSRGLCLVPVSCTLQVGHDISGADYWAPAPFNSGF